MVIRADTERRFLIGTVGGPWFYSCSGVIKVYNAGPNRVTANEGVVRGQGRHTGRGVRPARVQPDAPRDALAATHDEHGGIVKMCVLLAGADKLAEEKVRDAWIDEVRAPFRTAIEAHP